jgi:hypothetical protein
MTDKFKRPKKTDDSNWKYIVRKKVGATYFTFARKTYHFDDPITGADRTQSEEVLYPPWIFPWDDDQKRQFKLPQNRRTIVDLLRGNRYRSAEQVLKEKGKAIIDNTINKNANISRVKTVARSSIKSDIIRHSWTEPIAVKLLNKPFAHILSRYILDGQDLSRYTNGFDRPRKFRVVFPQLKWHNQRVDQYTPVMIKSVSSNPFNELGVINTNDNNGNFTISALDSTNVTAESYEDFVNQLTALRRSFNGDFDIRADSDYFYYIGLTPSVITEVTDLENIPMHKGLTNITNVMNYEIPDEDGKYCVLIALTHHMKSRQGWKMFDEHGVARALINEFKKAEIDIERGVTINDLCKWNKKHNYRLTIHAFDPLGKLVVHQKGRSDVFSPFNFSQNNKHIYPINDTTVNRSIAQTHRLPRLDSSHISGVFVIHESVPEDPETNIIIPCKNPRMEAIKFAERIIKSTRISSVVQRNEVPYKGRIVRFESLDIHDRYKVAELLKKLTGESKFDTTLTPCPSWTSLPKLLFDVYAGRTKGIFSEMNNEIRNTLDPLRTKSEIHTLKDFSDIQTVGVDIKGAYRNEATNNSEPYSVFDKMCYLQPFENFDNPGIYIIGPFVVYRNGVKIFEHPNTSIEFRPTAQGWYDAGYYDKSNIKGYVKPAHTISPEIFKKTMEMIMSLEEIPYLQRKLMCNCLIGSFGVMHKKERLYYTTNDKDTAYATQLKEFERNAGKSTARIDEYENFFFGIITNRVRLERDTLPIASQIISNAKLTLTKTIEHLAAQNCNIIGWSTDCVIIENKVNKWAADLPDEPEQVKETYAFDIPPWCVLKPDELPKEFKNKAPKDIKINIPQIEVKRSAYDPTKCIPDTCMLTGEAGSGKTHKLKGIIDKYPTTTSFTSTHAAKVNLHPTTKTIASLTMNGKRITGKRLIGDECGTFDRVNFCDLIRAREHGSEIILSGDTNQGLPFNDEFINIMNHPMILWLCNYNVITVPYNPETGRYDDELHSALKELKETGRLPQALLNCVVDPKKLVNYSTHQVITKYIDKDDCHKKINTLHGYKYEIGAKIRLRVNDYIKHHEDLCNGFKGEIAEINENMCTLRGYPNIWIQLGAPDELYDIDDITELDKCTKKHKPHLELAHCITVIRAQGQSFDKVLITQVEEMKTLNEVYTALSRGKTLRDTKISGDVMKLAEMEWKWAIESTDIKIHKIKGGKMKTSYQGYTSIHDIIELVNNRMFGGTNEVSYLKNIAKIYNVVGITLKPERFVWQEYPKYVRIKELVGGKYIVRKEIGITLRRSGKEAIEAAKKWIMEQGEAPPSV